MTSQDITLAPSEPKSPQATEPEKLKMVVTFELEADEADELQARATHAKRNVHAEANILLLQALGLYEEYVPPSVPAKSRPKRPPRRNKSGANGAAKNGAGR